MIYLIDARRLLKRMYEYSIISWKYRGEFRYDAFSPVKQIIVVCLHAVNNH